MLARDGRTKEHEEKPASQFQLPCRDDDTYISMEYFLKMMDDYYKARGWDKKYGWPLMNGLRGLDLEDVGKKVENFRKMKKCNVLCIN